MAQYRTKSIAIEATRWWSNGDHPADGCVMLRASNGEPFLSEGKVVRYFRDPAVGGPTVCALCGQIMDVHGWVDNPAGGHVVCPGDWIITTTLGAFYPCKPDIFDAAYEAVA